MTDIIYTTFRGQYGPRVRLSYPFDRAVNEAVKQIEHRAFDRDLKQWSIPAERLDTLKAALPESTFTEQAAPAVTDAAPLDREKIAKLLRALADEIGR